MHLNKMPNQRLIIFRLFLIVLFLIVFFAFFSICRTILAQTQGGEVIYPDYIGYVNDYAGLLDVNWENEINHVIFDLEERTGCEVAVVTVTSLYGKSIDEYANGLFRYWGIGKKEYDNGVLLIISTEGEAGNRDIRIEVGYGLEDTITDLEAGRILREIIIPKLKEGNYGQGVYDGVKAIANEIYRDFGFEELPGASLSVVEVASEGNNFVDSGKGFFICFGIIFFLFLVPVVIKNIFIKKCPKCKKLTLKRTVTVLRNPTRTSCGVSLITRVCKNCGFNDMIEIKTPKISSKSSRASWWGGFGGGSGRSSGGFGGFGGGSSGGGGASGKW